jgi:hypothetical protein
VRIEGANKGPPPARPKRNKLAYNGNEKEQTPTMGIAFSPYGNELQHKNRPDHEQKKPGG